MIEVSESSNSSASSESGEEEEEEEEEGVRVVEWTPSGALRALGEWERHTTVSRTVCACCFACLLASSIIISH